jgi:hypothetical protein
MLTLLYGGLAKIGCLSANHWEQQGLAKRVTKHRFPAEESSDSIMGFQN